MTVAELLFAVGSQIELLTRSTILIGVAWLAAHLVGRAGGSAAMRHLAWLSCIASLLLLPLASAVMPDVRLPILPQGSAASESMGLAEAEGRGGEAARIAEWNLILWIIYFSVTAALVSRLLFAARELVRIWQAADPELDPGWQTLLVQTSRSLSLRRKVQLRIARGPAMPMTWGTFAPKVLLPAAAMSWPRERREHVLLHELAHVARRDSLGQSVASLACAVYWFHPGVWFAARQLRIEQEYSSDDLVLTAGAVADRYAHDLLELAATLRRPAPAMHCAAMTGRSQLERRLVAIIGAGRKHRAGSAFAVGSSCVALLSTWLIATALPVRATETRADILTNRAAAVGAAGRQPVPITIGRQRGDRTTMPGYPPAHLSTPPSHRRADGFPFPDSPLTARSDVGSGAMAPHQAVADPLPLEPEILQNEVLARRVEAQLRGPLPPRRSRPATAPQTPLPVIQALPPLPSPPSPPPTLPVTVNGFPVPR